MSGRREKFSSEGAKDFLRGGEDAAVVLAEAGDIEQAKQNPLGADADGVVEISGHAFADEDGSDVGAFDLREYGGDGLDGRRGGGRGNGRGSALRWPRAKLAQEWSAGKRGWYCGAEVAARRAALDRQPKAAVPT